MRRRVNPNQIVLGMMARGCEECKSVQHVWFKTTEDWDNWTCPICEGRIEPNEDYIQTQGTDTDRNGESEEEISDTPEDSEEE